jgi:hypothetical protein
MSANRALAACLSPGRGFNLALAARETEEEGPPSSFDPDDEELVIIRGSKSDDIDGAIWEDLESGQPPKWLVMKEVSKVMPLNPRATCCSKANF